MDAVRWCLRERVLDPFGEDSAGVGLRAALGGAGDPPAGESFRSMVLSRFRIEFIKEGCSLSRLHPHSILRWRVLWSDPFQGHPYFGW